MDITLEAVRKDLPNLTGPLPGPRGRAIIERDARTVSPSYTRSYPLVAAKGEGAIVEDVDGNRFLDFQRRDRGRRHAATAIPKWCEAIQEQAARLIHMSGTDFYYERMVAWPRSWPHRARPASAPRLFRQLRRRGHGGRDQAGALRHGPRQDHRLSRRLPRPHHGRAFAHRAQGRPARRIRPAGAGRDPRALSLLLPLPVRQGAGHLRGGVRASTSRTRCSRRSRRPEETAAIVVEPVQGEGGYIVPPQEILRRAGARRREYGILLVFDEVQSGMGRTGKMWAAEHFGVVPDIFTVAKGIASGMPLGATVARADMMTWPPGAHASTFGGNPVSCAAALVTIALLEEGLVDNAARDRRVPDGADARRGRRDSRSWAMCAGWG